MKKLEQLDIEQAAIMRGLAEVVEDTLKAYRAGGPKSP